MFESKGNRDYRSIIIPVVLIVLGSLSLIFYYSLAGIIILALLVILVIVNILMISKQPTIKYKEGIIKLKNIFKEREVNLNDYDGIFYSKLDPGVIYGFKKEDGKIKGTALIGDIYTSSLRFMFGILIKHYEENVIELKNEEITKVINNRKQRGYIITTITFAVMFVIYFLLS